MSHAADVEPPRPRGLRRHRSFGHRLFFRRLCYFQLARIIPRRLLAGDRHRRVFVSRMGGIGDLVLLAPVLDRLAERYVIDFGAAGEPYLSLLRHHPAVSQIYTPFIYHPRRPAQRRLIERVLAPFYARVLLLEFPDDDYWKAGRHVGALLAEQCGCPPPGSGRVYLADSHHAAAETYCRANGLTDFVFVAQVIRDRQPFRSWPLAHYHELYRRIRAECGATVLACTAGSDYVDLPPGVLRLPPMDLLTVAAVIARSRLFIGTDGGLTHVAAAVGVPTVSIHLGYPPEVCAALGKNVTVIRQSRPFEDPVLTTPERVFRTVGPLLAGR